ncbi:hypothetical protein, partial [Escherichia coli]|uniref:hypothetical protein n=1 Tax=Escherichia coli TaxID=562 RepID=UPI0010CBAE68
QDKEKGTVTLSSTLPGTYRCKAKAAPYDYSNYLDFTFPWSQLGWPYAFISFLWVVQLPTLVVYRSISVLVLPLTLSSQMSVYIYAF